MDRFLRTGRVRFLPMSEYEGDGRIVSTVDPDRVTTVDARRRVVNGTYNQVKVPSVTPPRYDVDRDATVIPPNDLVQIRRPWERYVIVGAGKTGIDSILFLLANGVAPERIRWIMPNDAWLLDRGAMQPDIVLDSVVAMVQSIADSPTIQRRFLRLEREGIVFRLDGQSLPTKWRCATVDRREFAQLHRVHDIVRMGRVQHVGRDEVRLDDGTIDVDARHPVRRLLGERAGADRPPPDLHRRRRDAAARVHVPADVQRRADRAPRAARPHGRAPQPHLPPGPPSRAGGGPRGRPRRHRREHAALQPPRRAWLRRSRLYLGHHAPVHRYLLGSGRMAMIPRRAAASMDRMQAHAPAESRRRPAPETVGVGA